MAAGCIRYAAGFFYFFTMKIIKQLKIISVLTLSIFTYNTVAMSSPDFVYRVSVPENLGTVKERWQSPRSRNKENNNEQKEDASRQTFSHTAEPKTVIHIQDAHSSREAQERVALLINDLVAREGIDAVYVEGAVGVLGVERFREFPVKEVRNAIMREYMERGKLTGPEYGAIISEAPYDLIGVEDEELFHKNFREFVAGTNTEKELQRALTFFASALSEARARYFSETLQEFHTAFQAFQTGDVKLHEFFPLLYSASEKSKLSILAYPRIAHFLERVNEHESRDSDYAALVDYDGFLKELRDLSFSVETRLAQSENEKKIVAYSFDVEDLKAVVTFSARPLESTQFREIFQAGKVNEIAFFLKSILALDEDQLNACSRELTQCVLRAASFYSDADRRSVRLVENTLSDMAAKGYDRGILVSGGYHSPDITAHLRARGVNYSVVAPLITHASPVLPFYEKMRGDFYGLRPELISTITGQELYLARNPLDIWREVTREEVAETMALILDLGAELSESERQTKQQELLDLLRSFLDDEYTYVVTPEIVDTTIRDIQNSIADFVARKKSGEGRAFIASKMIQNIEDASDKDALALFESVRDEIASLYGEYEDEIEERDEDEADVYFGQEESFTPHFEDDDLEILDHELLLNQPEILLHAYEDDALYQEVARLKKEWDKRTREELFQQLEALVARYKEKYGINNIEVARAAVRRVLQIEPISHFLKNYALLHDEKPLTNAVIFDLMARFLSREREAFKAEVLKELYELSARYELTRKTASMQRDVLLNSSRFVAFYGLSLYEELFKVYGRPFSLYTLIQKGSKDRPFIESNEIATAVSDLPKELREIIPKGFKSPDRSNMNHKLFSEAFSVKLAELYPSEDPDTQLVIDIMKDIVKVLSMKKGIILEHGRLLGAERFTTLTEGIRVGSIDSLHDTFFEDLYKVVSDEVKKVRSLGVNDQTVRNSVGMGFSYDDLFLLAQIKREPLERMMAYFGSLSRASALLSLFKEYFTPQEKGYRYFAACLVQKLVNEGIPLTEENRVIFDILNSLVGANYGFSSVRYIVLQNEGIFTADEIKYLRENVLSNMEKALREFHGREIFYRIKDAYEALRARGVSPDNASKFVLNGHTYAVLNFMSLLRNISFQEMVEFCARSVSLDQNNTLYIENAITFQKDERASHRFFTVQAMKKVRDALESRAPEDIFGDDTQQVLEHQEIVFNLFNTILFLPQKASVPKFKMCQALGLMSEKDVESIFVTVKTDAQQAAHDFAALDVYTAIHKAYVELLDADIAPLTAQEIVARGLTKEAIDRYAHYTRSTFRYEVSRFNTKEQAAAITKKIREIYLSEIAPLYEKERIGGFIGEAYNNSKAQYSGYDIIILSSTNKEEAERKKRVVGSLFSHIQTANNSLGNKVHVYSFMVDKKAGQLISQIALLHEAQKYAAQEEQIGNLRSLIENKKVSVGIFQDGGEWTRGAPLSYALNNSRGALPLVRAPLGKNSHESYDDLFIRVINAANDYAQSCREKTTDVWWTDGIVVGAKANADSAKNRAAFRKRVVAFNRTYIDPKSLYDSGLFLLNENGTVFKAYSNKQFAAYNRETGQYVIDEARRKEWDMNSKRLTYDSGSYQISSDLLFDLYDYWTDKGVLGFGRDQKKEEPVRRDLEKFFTEPMSVLFDYRLNLNHVPKAHYFRSVRGRIRAEFLSQYVPRLYKELVHYLERDRISFSENALREALEFFLLFRDRPYFKHKHTLLGVEEVGTERTWMRYKRPLDIMNAEFQLLPDLAGKRLVFDENGKHTIFVLSKINEQSAHNLRVNARGIYDSAICQFRVLADNGGIRSVTLSLDEVRRGVSVSGVYVKGSIVQDSLLYPGSYIVDSIIYKSEGIIKSEASLVCDTVLGYLDALDSFLLKVNNEKSIKVASKTVVDIAHQKLSDPNFETPGYTRLTYPLGYSTMGILSVGGTDILDMKEDTVHNGNYYSGRDIAALSSDHEWSMVRWQQEKKRAEALIRLNRFNAEAAKMNKKMNEERNLTHISLNRPEVTLESMDTDLHSDLLRRFNFQSVNNHDGHELKNETYFKAHCAVMEHIVSELVPGEKRTLRQVLQKAKEHLYDNKVGIVVTQKIIEHEWYLTKYKPLLDFFGTSIHVYDPDIRYDPKHYIIVALKSDELDETLRIQKEQESLLPVIGFNPNVVHAYVELLPKLAAYIFRTYDPFQAVGSFNPLSDASLFEVNGKVADEYMSAEHALFMKEQFIRHAA
jgi:hypothetical protein